jgi:hypothetical protein
VRSPSAARPDGRGRASTDCARGLDVHSADEPRRRSWWRVTDSVTNQSTRRITSASTHQKMTTPAGFPRCGTRIAASRFPTNDEQPLNSRMKIPDASYITKTQFTTRLKIIQVRARDLLPDRLGPEGHGDVGSGMSLDRDLTTNEPRVSQAEAIDPWVTSPLCAAKAARTSSFSREGTPK